MATLGFTAFFRSAIGLDWVASPLTHALRLNDHPP